MLQDDEWVTAAVGAAAAKHLTGLCQDAAADDLIALATGVARVVGCSSPDHPCLLTLAALSAGPGSDLQRHMFSVLCTMAKLSSFLSSTMKTHSSHESSVSDSHSPAITTAQSRGYLSFVAANAAAAMTGGAAGMQRHDPHDSGSNAGAATCFRPTWLVHLGSLLLDLGTGRSVFCEHCERR
mgnify:CR=1 FL=1